MGLSISVTDGNCDPDESGRIPVRPSLVRICAGLLKQSAKRIGVVPLGGQLQLNYERLALLGERRAITGWSWSWSWSWSGRSLR